MVTIHHSPLQQHKRTPSAQQQHQQKLQQPNPELPRAELPRKKWWNSNPDKHHPKRHSQQRKKSRGKHSGSEPAGGGAHGPFDPQPQPPRQGFHQYFLSSRKPLTKKKNHTAAAARQQNKHHRGESLDSTYFWGTSANESGGRSSSSDSTTSSTAHAPTEHSRSSLDDDDDDADFVDLKPRRVRKPAPGYFCAQPHPARRRSPRIAAAVVQGREEEGFLLEAGNITAAARWSSESCCYSDYENDKRRARTMEGAEEKGSQNGDERRSQHPQGLAAKKSLSLYQQDSSELSSTTAAEEEEAGDEPSFLATKQGKKNSADAVHSDDDPHNQSFDEREMAAHFADVESSFLPDNANVSTVHGGAGGSGERPGADDTYLELGAAATAGRNVQQDSSEISTTDRSELETPAGAYKTPGAGAARGNRAMPGSFGGDEDEEEEAAHETEDSGGHSSSPAVAAARRINSRNFSTADRKGHGATSRGEVTGSSSRPQTPTSQRTSSQTSTVKHEESPLAATASQPASKRSTLQQSMQSAKSSLSARLKRPGGRRQVSQSTISTVSEGESAADDNGGLDGLLLRNGSSTSRSTLLSRLPSLGSLASFGTVEETPAFGPGSSSVPVLRPTARTTTNEDDRPETPRANPHSTFTAPTDTVIAQHVQSIQVPETVARDFRARNPARSVSPEKRPMSSSGAAFGPGTATQQQGGGARRTLTLKEQNSKIDKLSKENFDLKLKIHFLDQALQNRSDDGVKELINQNVQFQTDLANERKETQSLRRRIREMERKLKEQEEALTAERRKPRKTAFDDDDDENPSLQAEMHEEILYLRQQLDHSENTISTLREDLLTKDFEKRKMSETMRGLAATRGEDSAGLRETMDMWQDLLNAEAGRREQAEEDAAKLREELNALRIERAAAAPAPAAQGRNGRGRARGRLGSEHAIADEDDEILQGLESDHAADKAMLERLQHENAELRRDLGAQTSMLTSRNRERERLQQEIEDLKLLHRKGDGGARSVAGESIFDRSVSRAHNRAPSRTSDQPGGGGAATVITDAERDEWDKKEGQLRDHNAELRIKLQELERTHAKHAEYVAVLEGDYAEMEQELGEAQEDLRQLQSERDEALQAYEEREAEYEQLKEEALAEIQALDEEKRVLEQQLDEALAKAQKTQSKLQNTSDGYKGLQGELREITQAVMNLEDEKQANMRTIATLERQLAEAEEEIHGWEQKCAELDQKVRKLEVTQESLQSEVSFLRDEQEGDKIKIGELEDALANAQQGAADAQEKLREVEAATVEERQQRDVLENKSKEEVQKVLDGLNAENAKSKDAIRALRRSLSAKEIEANSWRQKLEEYEQSLRQVLGDRNGTKQSLLGHIEKLQSDLEATATALDRAKMDLADKDRLLRHRDGLLESTSLESRRLSDLLEKERASRKRDLDSFEKASRGSASHIRTIAQQESRVLELESQSTQQQRKLAALEEKYRDQMHERNSLLLALWNRLSTLCGTEWAQSHSLLNGEITSLDTIQKHLPSFHKNVIAAVKQTECIIGDFKARIRRFEKEVLADYQTLNHNLDLRMRRLDAVEHAFEEHKRAVAEEAAFAAHQQQQQQQRSAAPVRSFSNKLTKVSAEEQNKLKNEIKLLKAELKFHRLHPSAMAQQMLNQQMQLNDPVHVRRLSSAGIPIPGGAAAASGSAPGSSGSTGSSTKKDGASASPARQIVAQLLRHHSSSSNSHNPYMAPPEPAHYDEQQQQQLTAAPTPSMSSSTTTAGPAHPSEQRWVHRLKELERRLKQEREGRLLDRKGARQRLEEGRAENEELRGRLERELERRSEISLRDVADANSEVFGGQQREGERADVLD